MFKELTSLRTTGLFMLLCTGSSVVCAQSIQDQLRSCRAIADSGARLSCYDKLDDKLLAAPQASGAFAVITGLVSPAQADVLRSHIVGPFEGWNANATITLANGQVWRVVDGSSAWFGQMVNPKVTVSTGVFGALYLQIEGQNHLVRVRRIQ